jgi:hypothetical protein
MHCKALPYTIIALLFVVLSCWNCTSEPLPANISEIPSAKDGVFETKQNVSYNESRHSSKTTAIEKVIVDADFPGGNIIVERIKGDTIILRPDQRDSATWWFYWYFRVRGAGGRTLNFKFRGDNPIGTQGPAFSTDGGETWSWLGPQAVKGASFTYEFGDEDEEVRFCFSIPYVEDDLRRFLQKYKNHSHLTIKKFCQTRKGRPVEKIHAGKINGNPKYRIFVTARHHACETIASYALEGLLEVILSNTDTGQWYQNNAEFLIIPFVDKDGVEDGDQGKNRRPHDHNRDYMNDSIYPSVKAIREFVPQWSDTKLKASIDLHCPHIRGRYNEFIYMVGSNNPDIWRQQQEFAHILESAVRGELPYSAKNNLPFGTAWNTGDYYGRFKSCRLWAGEQAGMSMATTFEIPYANAGTTVVTADNARAFGRDLAQALRRYLEDY